MPNRLQTSAHTLAELFADPFAFSIPGYQRAFSWPLAEAERLLDDIATASGIEGDSTRETDYFLGTILLMQDDAEEQQALPVDSEAKAAASRWSTQPFRRVLRRKSAEPASEISDPTVQQVPRPFDIVDGQQRILTLLVLAAVLRDFEPSSTSGQAVDLDSMVRIGGLRSISGQSGDAPRPSVAGKRPRIVRPHDPSDFFARYVALPGSCLSAPEDTEVLSTEEQLILSVRDHFVEEVSRLSSDQRQKLIAYMRNDCHVVVITTQDIDRAHHMFMVLNDRGRPLEYNDIIKAEILRGLPAGEREEARTIWSEGERRLSGHFSDFFSHLRLAEGHGGHRIISGIRAAIAAAGGGGPFLTDVFAPYADSFEKILSVSGEQCTLPDQIRAPIMSMSRLNSSEWIPSTMLILMRYAESPEQAANLLTGIEKYAYLLRLLCLSGGKRQTRFRQVAKAIHSNQDWSQISASIQLTRDEVRNVQNNLKDLHGRSLQSCKLVLLRLNDELDGHTLNIDPKDYSVEHILPQRPKAKSEWCQSIPDLRQRMVSTAALGNLGLITADQNQRARNEDFSKKLEIYKTPENGKPILAITRQVFGADNWGPKQISERDLALKALVSRVWNIDLPELRKAS